MERKHGHSCGCPHHTHHHEHGECAHHNRKDCCCSNHAEQVQEESPILSSIQATLDTLRTDIQKLKERLVEKESG
ncbi:MAG: hypothetical protein JW712_11745 [Dehalococcoidales bacterium]|nr:hypothetical protein [Dehalococcoidales bacterium]